MTKNAIKGKVYVVKDNIDTDVIIPARYLTTMDPQTLAKHAMEDLDPKEYPVPFLNKDGTCDYKIIVAGKNFGCGSSREHAPIALHASGIEAVVAASFARIYYRNSVNGGIILPLESTLDLTDYFKTGDVAEIDLGEHPVIERPDDPLHPETGHAYPINPFGPVKDIIEAGGLTEYNLKKLGLK
nr:methanogen homoaconitase small subunit [uncultured archaeon]